MLDSDKARALAPKGTDCMESTLSSLASRTVSSKISSNVVTFARMRPWHTFWGVVCLVIVVVAAAGPLVLPLDAYWADYNKLLSPPDAEYWTGTDQIGRDQTSRLVYGARSSLIVAACSILMGTIVGGVWGLVSGYLGGKTDLISERFIEILLALPGLILAYLMILVFGDGFIPLITAIAITRIGAVERVVRSVALSVKQTMYVEAARSIGASQLRIMWRHVFPQCVAVIIVLITVNIGGVIILEASLSFLGLGIAPPTPTWGRMLSDSTLTTLYPIWWMVTYPGLLITLTVLSFNLFGDGLRDALDPRLRGTM